MTGELRERLANEVHRVDWRPLAWLWSGLDIRSLVVHRGELLRVPEFNPSDPDSPVLPDFDIRIDRFELDRMGIARGIAGDRPIVAQAPRAPGSVSRRIWRRPASLR